MGYYPQWFGIWSILAAFLHYLIALQLLRKNSSSRVTRLFFGSFFAIAFALTGIFFYQTWNFTSVSELELLYLGLMTLGGIGVILMVAGTRALLYPRENPFYSPMFVLMALMTFAWLWFQQGITHDLIDRNPEYTLEYAIFFVLTLTLPASYCVYHLSFPDIWIPPQRREWIKRLRLGFFITAGYPVFEAMSGIEPFLISELISQVLLVLSSVIILTALPGVHDWFFDEVKLLATVDSLDMNPKQSISGIWDFVDEWQSDYDPKPLTHSTMELESYLEEIQELMLKLSKVE